MKKSPIRIVTLGALAAFAFAFSFILPAAQEKPKLKVFISVDMEGISGIVHGDQTTPGTAEYAAGRKWMAQDVNAAVEGALEAGATEVVVNDSHGSMRNIVNVKDFSHPRGKDISHRHGKDISHPPRE